MSLTFYYGSGSVFAWRVFLALEHKRVDYQLVVLSFQAGDHKKPEYLALNPRHTVPLLVDDDYALYESAAIVEYLDERFPDAPRLFPGGVRERALIRRVIHEADSFLAPHQEDLIKQLWFRPAAEADAAIVGAARDALVAEFPHFERALGADWFGGEGPNAADLSVYPFFKTMWRFEVKRPDLGLMAALPPKLAAWMKRVESLSYYDKAFPPHWR